MPKDFILYALFWRAFFIEHKSVTLQVSFADFILHFILRFIVQFIVQFFRICIFLWFVIKHGIQ